MVIKVDLVTLEAIREPVPRELRGLKPETLRDLQTALDPVPEHLRDIEFWPEEIAAIEFNANTHKVGSEVLTPDTDRKVVVVTHETVALTDQERSELLDATFASRNAEVDALRLTHTYKDVTVIFPSGPATIQFRDEADRMNLSSVAAGATALVLSGTPDTPMQYRTVDNVNQDVTAAEMLAIASDVLNQKQAIVANAWNHKDLMKALYVLEDRQGLLDYDVTTGW